ncbi:MAG TPA: flagellar biosynthetic protein FliO [Bacillales bacterium]|nr:flagellar biosynthetic protein FliO [Bacillales bacterium]
MRNQTILLLMAAFVVMMVSAGIAEAAEGDGGSVADHFQKDSPDDSGSHQNQSQKEKPPVTKTSGTVWMFVKVLLVLTVVIALIYLLLRFVNARTKSYTQGRTIQNVGGVSVGSNRSVQLVKVGERVFVVGVGDSVSLLKEIDDATEVAGLLDENRHEDVIDHSIWKFRDWMKKSQGAESHGTNFKKMLEGRLKQMKQDRKEAAEQLHKKGSDK